VSGQANGPATASNSNRNGTGPSRARARDNASSEGPGHPGWFLAGPAGTQRGRHDVGRAGHGGELGVFPHFWTHELGCQVIDISVS